MGQEGEQSGVLQERARPAMREEQRDRVIARTAGVYEVDRDSLDFDHVVGQLVEPSLKSARIERASSHVPGERSCPC